MSVFIQSSDGILWFDLMLYELKAIDGSLESLANQRYISQADSRYLWMRQNIDSSKLSRAT
jgi:hypothetical protein